MQRTTGTQRLFVDQAEIIVRGGRGGDGCVSFRREKYVPKGGPDGGDGGRGGSVFLLAREDLSTLLDLAGRHHWIAENGRPGSGANKTGRDGEDCIVPVPVGSLVYDAESGRLLKDLVAEGQRICVAPGGRGGHGNLHYVSSTNQAPREAQPGRPGRERRLRVELKLIADAGFVGLPNAGKSTLLARLTAARPKIAPYPFTTTEPQLGIAELPGYRRLVLADIPGLLEGAHQGVGLGDAFLRHIERTRAVVHLVDLAPPEGSPTPAAAYHIVRRELVQYSARLAERREVVVGTKLDLTGAPEALRELERQLGRPVLGISGVTGAGLRRLLEELWTAVEEVKQIEGRTPPALIDLDAEPGALAADLESLADEPLDADAENDSAETENSSDPPPPWSRT